MEEKEKLQLIDSSNLDTSNTKIINDVINETDIDKVKDLTNLFNLNIAKKNMVRLVQLQTMLDKVNDQALARLENKPDEMSHRELLDYMTAIQNSIDKSSKIVETVDTTPIIQLNEQHNEVNINVTDSLDRESKTKVLDAIKSLLDKAKQPSNMIIDANIDEKEGE